MGSQQLPQYTGNRFGATKTFSSSGEVVDKEKQLAKVRVELVGGRLVEEVN